MREYPWGKYVITLAIVTVLSYFLAEYGITPHNVSKGALIISLIPPTILISVDLSEIGIALLSVLFAELLLPDKFAGLYSYVLKTTAIILAIFTLIAFTIWIIETVERR